MLEHQAVEAETARAPKSESSNRRQFDRVLCQVDVTLESESTFYQGFAENISSGGLFVATYDLREMGSMISLEFTIPGHDRTVHVEGEVRWIREYNEMTPDMIPGMGVKFSSISESDARAITEFVRQREPLFYDDDL